MESRRCVESFPSKNCDFALIGTKNDITHARTALKKRANMNRLLLLSVRNCLLLNPAVFFQSNHVFQFLAARFFESYKEVFHAFEHSADRTDGVVHPLVLHSFQL